MPNAWCERTRDLVWRRKVGFQVYFVILKIKLKNLCIIKSVETFRTCLKMFKVYFAPVFMWVKGLWNKLNVFIDVEL